MKTIKWVVDPPPTGRYRSFEKRHWPSAEYKDEPFKGRSAGYLTTVLGEEYVPSSVKDGTHSEIEVRVYDWSVVGRRTLKLKATYKTLGEAKKALEELVEKNPGFRLDPAK